jgi:hypothetical protein
MNEYVRLFFEGEAFQHMLACFCNGMQKRSALMKSVNPAHKAQYPDPAVGGGQGGQGSSQAHAHAVHNTLLSGMTQSSHLIARVICTLIQSSVCVRLTPVGLAPITSDITFVLPYSQMSKLQIDFLQDILLRATFNACANTADPIKAIAYGNEVVIVTTLQSQRIWNGHGIERPALHHQFAADGCKRKRGCAMVDDAQCESVRKQLKLQEACKLLTGRQSKAMLDKHSSSSSNISSSSSAVYLDETDVLKAFCACVFRSKVHKDNALREGICNVVLQMVIGEIGTTKDVLKSVNDFVQAAKTLDV